MDTIYSIILYHIHIYTYIQACIIYMYIYMYVCITYFLFSNNLQYPPGCDSHYIADMGLSVQGPFLKKMLYLRSLNL